MTAIPPPLAAECAVCRDRVTGLEATAAKQVAPVDLMRLAAHFRDMGNDTVAAEREAWLYCAESIDAEIRALAKLGAPAPPVTPAIPALATSNRRCRSCIHPAHLGTCAKRSGGTAYACGCSAVTLADDPEYGVAHALHAAADAAEES